MSAVDADGPVVVAIDGPSGAGKSTAARLLAEALRLPYVNTGAMYRALALKAMRAAVDPADGNAMAELAAGTEIRFARQGEDTRCVLDGETVEDELRAPGVAAAASVVAEHQAVRRRLVDLQRIAAADGGVVEGRDIGTVVFPDTPFKFFLEARLEVRASRRAEQLRAKGGPEPDLGEIQRRMAERDRRDAAREASPMTCDDSYVRIDTSDRTAEETVGEIVTHMQRRRDDRA